MPTFVRKTYGRCKNHSGDVMKKVFCVLLTVVLCICLKTSLSADESDEFRDKVYSSVESISLPDEVNELGIDIDDPESLSEIDHNSAFEYIVSLIKKSILKPLKVLLIATALSLITQIITSLTDKPESYEIISVIICFISVSGYVINSLTDALTSVTAVQGFMAAYVPILASISIASGNVSGALSYNAIVLYTCESATLFATLVLKPILLCITVSSITQAINLEMPDFVSSLRKAFITMIGLVMTIFTGIISLQATVGRATDSIGLRAGKYLVSSFVPILGYTITQSYQTIKTSLSAIRSTIGAFGIVIIIIVFMAPIISLMAYRIVFKLCEWIATLCQSRCIAKMFNGLSDVYSLTSVITVMYLLMLVISTGMIIALGEGI